MARIPEAEIERVKGEIDLEALVRSKGIELKRHGSKDLAGRCPFHEEETASFIVTPGKNLWHCMGCGKGGSVIDFVMLHEGVSFRHAYELLAGGEASAILRASKPVKKSLVPKLETPVAFDADEQAALRQVIAYYRERLKQTPAALEYLRGRGVSEEALNEFQIGFSDRTLGLRLPPMATKAGSDIRERLKKAGILRAESGHEHFNGSVVFPIFDEHGAMREIYGRKIGERLRQGTAYHLYLPGPHAGIFNRAALKASREIILCEAVFDALAFWCNGFRNVTCIYGTEGFSDELWQAFLDCKTERIYLAYDRDQAGDRAAERDASRFLSKGIECLRVKFPGGMDANEYACKVRPADKALRLLIQSAEWLGKGTPNAPILNVTRAPSSFLAASKLAAQPEAGAEEEAAKKEKVPLAVSVDCPAPVAPVELPEQMNRASRDVPVEVSGEDLTIRLGERSYRVRGLEKNNSFEVLRVNLRVMHNGLYHINVIDLYQAKARQHFIEEASRETLLDAELIKRDLGKLLLKLEEMQEERIRAAQAPVEPEVTMDETAREAALALLRDPRLLERLVEDFEKCGTVGERTNKLMGYLATISRKLDKPLGVIVQSSSAAGKSSLMEAVLAFVPEEERVKYSAMTGQSLYYLGERDIRHKILAIVEEEGAEKASYALKLLQSEGELTIASTSKDEQGRLKTEEYHVQGPVMIFLTTTAIDVDEELLNRCIVLSVDESREQTEAIHRLQREAETLEGLVRKIERERVLTLHRNTQRLLRPLHVVNPHAPKLTFLSDRTRTRRDHVKYLTLIRSVALLHQHQREMRTLPDGSQYIEATLADIATANQLAHEVLGRSLDELPPQTRRLLGLLSARVARECTERAMERSDFLFSRRDVREWTGWGNTQLKIHLGRLEDMEYLVIRRHPRHAQARLYELAYDGNGVDGGRFLSGLIDSETLTPSYDANRAGANGNRAAQNEVQAGCGRPPVGGVSGGGRVEKTPAKAHEQRLYSLRPPVAAQNAQTEEKMAAAS